MAILVLLGNVRTVTRIFLYITCLIIFSLLCKSGTITDRDTNSRNLTYIAKTPDFNIHVLKSLYTICEGKHLPDFQSICLSVKLVWGGGACWQEHWPAGCGDQQCSCLACIGPASIPYSTTGTKEEKEWTAFCPGVRSGQRSPSLDPWSKWARKQLYAYRVYRYGKGFLVISVKLTGDCALKRNFIIHCTLQNNNKTKPKQLQYVEPELRHSFLMINAWILKIKTD